jgi:hypothetical protein
MSTRAPTASMLLHARVIDLFGEQDAVLPDQWCHDLAEGSLT